MLLRFPSHALIRRELLVSLRKVRMIVFAALIVLACMAAIKMAWPSVWEIRTRGVMISSRLLDTMSVLMMLGCAFFLPGLAGVAISSERDQDTYDQLHLSLITPRGMAFGKLVNALGIYALLAIALLPVIGVIFFMVGVSWPDLIMRACLIGLMALATVSVGLYCSARFQRTAATIIMAYFGMLFVFGIPYWFLLVFFGRILRLDQLLPFHPDFLFIFFPPLSVFQAGMPVTAALVQRSGSAAYLLVFSLFFFWRTLRVLRRPPKARDLQEEKPIDDASLLDARRKRFPYYLIDPLKRKKPVEDGRNPVLVRELRWGLLGRLTVMVRMFYIALVVDMGAATIFVFASIGGGRDTMSAAMSIAIMIVCTCLACPALLATLLTKEREQGNLEALQMTLVPPRDIMAGKLGAALVQVAPLLTAALIVSAAMAGVFGLAWRTVPGVLIIAAGLLTLFVCVWSVATTCLTASLLSRRSAGALVLSYALNLVLQVGLCAGANIAISILDNTSYNLRWYDEFARRWSLALSPLVAYFELADSRLGARQAAVWATSCLMYLLLGVAFFAFCLYVFERRPARSKG